MDKSTKDFGKITFIMEEVSSTLAKVDTMVILSMEFKRDKASNYSPTETLMKVNIALASTMEEVNTPGKTIRAFIKETLSSDTWREKAPGKTPKETHIKANTIKA